MLLAASIMKSTIIFDCINRFLIELWTKDSCILLVNFNGHFDQPVIRFTYGRQMNSFEHVKPNIYVIQSKVHYLKDVLHHLERSTFFNPKAQFVLIIEKIEDLIFEILADFFIHNVVVMEEGKKDLVNLYSYQPNKKVRFNVSRSIHIGLCIEGSIRYEAVPNIFPTVEGFLTLKVGCSNSIPSMIFDDGVPTSGVDFELLQLISEKLEVQLEYTVVSDFIGRKDGSNNFFNGALGALSKREVDLVVGGVFPTSQALPTFDFTHPTVENDYAWIVPAPNTRPLWKSLVFTFSSVVWILYLLVFFISLTVLVLANKIVTFKSVKWSRELFMLYTTCLTSSGVNWKLKLYCKKMVYILWLLMNFIYSDCFSAKLLSNLVVKKYEDQMNLLDIANSDLKICIYADLIENLNNFAQDRILTCMSCEGCVNRTAFQRDLISVRSRRYVHSEIPRFYLDEEGEPLINFLDSIFMTTHDCMIFRKNHPFFTCFNEIIVRLSASGFVDKFTRQYTKKDVNLRPVIWRMLNFKILFFVFRLLIYGLIIAFVVFIFEVVISKMKNKKYDEGKDTNKIKVGY